jgi:hypothetical protein
MKLKSTKQHAQRVSTNAPKIIHISLEETAERLVNLANSDVIDFGDRLTMVRPSDRQWICEDRTPFPGVGYSARLLEFEEMLKTITNSTHPFFRSVVTQSGNVNWMRTPLSKFFQELKYCTALNMPGCPQTEHAKLFFKHFYSLGLQKVYFTQPGRDIYTRAESLTSIATPEVSSSRMKTQAEICNELAHAMQQEGKTQAFKQRIAVADDDAFEATLVRETQAITDLEKKREHIFNLREDFLRKKCGVFPGDPAFTGASRRARVKPQLNRFTIARLTQEKKIIERQLVIAKAWHGKLLVEALNVVSSATE